MWNMIPVIKSSKNEDSLLKFVQSFLRFQKTTTVIPADFSTVLLPVSRDSHTEKFCSCATADMNQKKSLLLKYVANCTSHYRSVICLNKTDAFI